jgi:flagellar basal-body rod protein FlgF
MDRMLYVAMTGAQQALVAQTATAHNLANASTAGFRADLEAFRAMPVFGPGHPSRAYAMAERPGVDLASGASLATGRDLDVAVQGKGYIAVQGADGREGYTRAGDLRVDASGLITNGAGQIVLGNGGPITLPPAEKIEIGVDGTVSIRPVGQGAQTLAIVDRIRLANPAESKLEKGLDGLLRLRNGEAATPDANVRVAAGHLEASNVNAVEAMVTMISTARMFEMQVKLMNETAKNDEAAAQLLRAA